MPKRISVTDLKRGDVVSLTIITDVFQTQGDYIVESKNRYSQEDMYEWFEVLLQGGSEEKLWLEWEEDDELEIGLNLRQVSLKELGLTPKLLEQFDAEGRGSFTYEGIKYELDESDEAMFHRNCEKRGIPFYYWDFEDKTGEYFAGIERWTKKEYEAHLGIYIEESDIEIYPS